MPRISLDTLQTISAEEVAELEVMRQLVALGEIHWPADNVRQRELLEKKRTKYEGRSGTKKIEEKSAFEKYSELCVRFIDYLKFKNVLLPRTALTIFYQVFGIKPNNGEAQFLYKAYTLIFAFCGEKGIEAMTMEDVARTAH